jgi:hypothetical protein
MKSKREAGAKVADDIRYKFTHLHFCISTKLLRVNFTELSYRHSTKMLLLMLKDSGYNNKLDRLT